MKVAITDLDHPNNTERDSRISLGAGSDRDGIVGHALFFKANGQSLTVITDRDSLELLHEKLTQYLEEH